MREVTGPAIRVLIMRKSLNRHEINIIVKNMSYQTPKLSEEVAVAEVVIKVREVGKDVDEVLFKAARRVLGTGSTLLGSGLIYNATKEEDQTRAVVKGLLGIASVGVGLYLIFK